MGPPTPRCGVQEGPDPRQPRHQFSSHQARDGLAMVSVVKRRAGSIQSLPGIGGKFNAVRKLAVSQKTAHALRSTHLPVVKGFGGTVERRMAEVGGHVAWDPRIACCTGDPKCKKRHQQGASSSAPTQIKKDCHICMRSKRPSKFFCVNGCKHSYCSRCLGSYIETKLNMNATLIRCPDPACEDGKLEPLACQLFIEKKLFDRWCDALSESAVGAKFYCPFEDCSALLIDERGQEVMQESECPHCHRLFCANCRVPWHAELSCRKFLKMEKLRREKRQDETLMLLAQKRKWQRCPKCKFYVEKTSGCMFIKCWCGSTFCYGCASEMKVDHYCQKCQR